MNNENKGLTPLGWFVMLLFIAACTGGAWWFFSGHRGPGALPLVSTPPSSAAPTAAPLGGNSVAINIAYGTEKKRWLEWAVEEYGKRQANVQINLIPMGSVEAAKDIPGSTQKIHGWTPATGAYRDAFEQEWELRRGKKPIIREETLALTPMVFVFWQERYTEFEKKMGPATFSSVLKALNEQTGWQGIAGKSEWGVFKFGHAHPNQSNSGLMALLLLGAEHFNTTASLTMAQVLDREFQQQVGALAHAVSGLSNSTGTLMKDMVLRGPSTYDAIFVYEAVAIDYLRNAQGRWGSLRIVYPKYNCWADNPFYILDAPGVTKDEGRATQDFLNFLLSEPVQRKALEHGFRPGNPSVPVLGPDSPFTLFTEFGLRVQVDHVAHIPSSDVLNNLIATWQRAKN